MTSLNIEANLDSSAIETLKNFITTLDPNATITQNNPYQLSQKDKNRLKETLELHKQGKLEYRSLEESKAMNKQHLRNLGAKI